MPIDRRGTRGIKSNLPDKQTLDREVLEATRQLKEITDYLQQDVQDASAANKAYEKLKAVLSALK